MVHNYVSGVPSEALRNPQSEVVKLRSSFDWPALARRRLACRVKISERSVARLGSGINRSAGG